VYARPGPGADAGRKLGTLRGHAADVTCLALSDASLLSGDAGGTLRLWAADDFKLVGRALRGHVGAVAACAALPGGGPLASAGVDGTLRLWDAQAAAAAPLASLECITAVAALAYDVSGGEACPSRLYAAGGFLDCVDVASATVITTLLDILDGGEPITRLSCHASLLAAGFAGGAALWDVRQGPRVVAQLACQPGRGSCGGLHLGEWQLAGAFDGDDAVVVYDVRAAGAGRLGVPLLRLEAPGRVADLACEGTSLLAALQGRPCLAWAFQPPALGGSAAAAGVEESPAKQEKGKEKKGGASNLKVRGRFPKRSTR